MNDLTDTQGAGSWRQSARSALIVLTSISLLNYLDRYIVASLVNELTQPPPSGLGLSGAQVGWLSSGFVIVYLLNLNEIRIRRVHRTRLGSATLSICDYRKHRKLSSSFER